MKWRENLERQKGERGSQGQGATAEQRLGGWVYLPCRGDEKGKKEHECWRRMDVEESKDREDEALLPSQPI